MIGKTCAACGNQFFPKKSRFRFCSSQCASSDHSIKPTKGERFGRLVLTGAFRAERRLYAECLCDCGAVTWPVLSAVKSGKTRSCGCLSTEIRLSAVRSRRRAILDLLEDGHAPEPNTGCWLWVKGHKRSTLRGSGGAGYGSLRINGKASTAHRVAYEAWVGVIPSGLWVLHRCDTPACINPSHLFLGDAQDNSDDMVSKGRKVVFRGGRHPRGRLSDSQVIELRRLGMTKAGELADALGVDREVITRAVSGRSYRHLDSVAPPSPRRRRAPILNAQEESAMKPEDQSAVRASERDTQSARVSRRRLLEKARRVVGAL